jgi:hypothetical protein
MPARFLISAVVVMWHLLEPSVDVARAQGTLEEEERAEPPCAPSEVDALDALATLEHALAHDAAEARRARRVRGSIGAVLGAMLLPVGVVLLGKGHPVQNALGVGLVVGGATQLANSLAVFFPTATERLRRDHEQRRTRAGISPGELLRETEQIWRTRAKDEYIGRRIVGIGYAALGAVLAPVGMTLLLMEGQLFDISRQGQYKLGSALLGAGVPFLGLGLQLIFEAGPLERSYAAYARGRLERPGAGLSGALLPTRGGAVVSLAARY